MGWSRTRSLGDELMPKMVITAAAVVGGARLMPLRTLSVTANTLQEIASATPGGVPKVVLKKGKTQLFKDGSPMVYSGAVDRIIGRPPPKTGDVVLVADGTEKPIAWGLYNSASMFCVRLMQLEDEASRVQVLENGICYLVSLAGQKTGFYADQRENRHFLSTISDNQNVLDLYCYSGGFALNAASGGAVNVTGVDTSLPALELANENIILNDLDPQKISFVKKDAAEFMKDAILRDESWDIVILDPPKLAPRKKVLQSASGMYRNLNCLAMQLTKKNGLLMTCSCSGAMTQSGMFLRVLQGAASMSGRKITILRQSGAACDHPIDPSYPEGAYLSNVLLRVH